MANYRIGTISVTNGSKAVVGSGTDFIAAGVMEGDELQLVDANLFGTGNVYEVASVTDATHLTLLQSYQGTTASGKAYVIKYTGAGGTQTNTALRLARFLDKWQGKYDATVTEPTADGIPQADASGKISLGWLPSDYGACATAAATVTKTVALAGFVLAAGAHVRVKFTNANSASAPVLNVNDTGAKAITFKGVAIAELLAGVVYDFIYDGTNWELSYGRNVANGVAGINSEGKLTQDTLGNSATATKANQDNNGDAIADTYLRKDAKAVSGDLDAGTNDAKYITPSALRGATDFVVITGFARTGDNTFTMSGDVSAQFPAGKLLRWNDSDTYLCRVYGTPTVANSVTTVTVWMQDQTQVIPASPTKLERSRLSPVATANKGSMSGTATAAVIAVLQSSYCCGDYWVKG